MEIHDLQGQGEAMKYQDIKTFHQRLQTSRPTSEAEINATLLEEIAELRHYIEWHIQPKQNWAYPTNNIAP